MAGTAVDDLARLRSAPVEDWYVYSAELGWERRPGYRGKSFRIAREFDDCGLLTVDSHQLRPTGRRRILFLGDSNTFGSHVRPEETFVEVVDELLPEVDAINLGVPGYTSFQGRKMLESALDLAPDIVVISFNFNDRRVVMHSGEVDSDARFREIHGRSVKRKVNSAAEYLHLYRALGFLSRRLGLLQGEGGEQELPPLDRLPARVRPDAYRDNLLAMVETARRHGVEVLLLVLRDNPVPMSHIGRGLQAQAEGDHQTAIENLRIARAQRRMFSDLARLHLARSYEAIGSPDLAEEALFLEHPTGIHGGSLRFPDTVYNEAMREVGRLTEVDVVEGGELLNRQPWVYVDHCHFDAEGHRRVGELIAERIAAMP